MKIKIILAIIFYIIINANCYSQQNLAPFKEYFDDLNAHYSVIDFSSQDEQGNHATWLMASYLNLYETTKDKDYLIKFINLSVNEMEHRKDAVAGQLFPSNPPKWTLMNDNPERTYYNTLITYPIAKFIYLVRSDNDLFNEPINTDCINISNLNNFPYNAPNFLTFGDYTNWLGKRIEETLWYLNAYYWDDNLGHIKFQGDDVAAELNFQSLFATLYLYMYRIHTQTNLPNGFGDYALSTSCMYNKLDKLADLYQGTFLCNNSNTSVNVFCDINEGSYAWGHWGWKNIDCDEYLNEDVSHGAMDAVFPMADYYTSNDFFPTSFYEKFHDTFTKNIYVSPWKFYNNVWGTDYDMDPAQHVTCGNATYNINGTLNFYWAEILNWMPLNEFDQNDNSIYDALILHTYNLKENIFTSYSTTSCDPSDKLGGPQSFLGLSQVVKAQWERECVNLTLKNRDVVYNQDFKIKNTLTVDPSQINTLLIPNRIESFADPEISTRDFTIENNVTVNMTAGNKIVLKPGFHALAGCNFYASIDESLCQSGGKSMVINNNPSSNTNSSYVKPGVTLNDLNKAAHHTTDNDSLVETSIAIIPNPIIDLANIVFTINYSTPVKITITDMYGILEKQVMNSNFEKGNHTVLLNGTGLSSGVYMCCLETNMERKCLHIVVTK